MTLSFGTTFVTFTVISDTEIQAVAPPGTGTVYVQATTWSLTTNTPGPDSQSLTSRPFPADHRARPPRRVFWRTSVSDRRWPLNQLLGIVDRPGVYQALTVLQVHAAPDQPIRHYSNRRLLGNHVRT
jgi:hypothetical protein